MSYIAGYLGVGAGFGLLTAAVMLVLMLAKARTAFEVNPLGYILMFGCIAIVITLLWLPAVLILIIFLFWLGAKVISFAWPARAR